jgi:hypothetical protein
MISHQASFVTCPVHGDVPLIYGGIDADGKCPECRLTGWTKPTINNFQVKA